MPPSVCYDFFDVRRSLVLRAAAPLTVDDIRRRVQAGARDLGVERVSLFGSYARGAPDGFSDVDLNSREPFLQRGRTLALARSSLRDVIAYAIIAASRKLVAA